MRRSTIKKFRGVCAQPVTSELRRHRPRASSTHGVHGLAVVLAALLPLLAFALALAFVVVRDVAPKSLENLRDGVLLAAPV